MKVLIVGSFDPITVGHTALIYKAEEIFGGESLSIVVMGNLDKKHMFTPTQRYDLVRETLPDYIDVELNTGMISELIGRFDDVHIVRGLRSGTDYEYEKSVEAFTREFGAATMYLSSDPDKSHISSSLVRNLILADGDYPNYIPDSWTLGLLNQFIIKNKSNEKA